MGSIDIWTILIFSLIVFITGLSFSRTGSNIKSFFAGGGAIPWWMSGLSLFMSFFSAGTFVVWGSIAYTNGLVAISIQWTMCIAGIIIGLTIAPMWNKTRVVTAAQFITQRLGYNTQKLYTFLFLIISMFTTGAFLYPVAKIIEVSTGISLYTNIIVLGLLITIYTAVGGLWAVIVTDVLQFIVLSTAVLIVVPLAFDKVDGITGFLSRIPEGHFDFFSGEYTVIFMIGMILYGITYIGGNWAYVQRYTSVAKPSDARKVGWFFSALYIISPVIWMLPPMIYRVVNPELEGFADEGAYLLMCREVLPQGMLGLMLGAMIFATSSSVNTTLNISAGVLTNDIFKKIFSQSTSRITMMFARTATLVFGILTIIVALMVPKMGGIVEVVLSVGAITGGPLFLPPIWALFSKRQKAWSILGVTIISLVINVFFKFISPDLLDLSLTRGLEMILGASIPAGLLFISEVYFIITGSGQAGYEHYMEIRKEYNYSDNFELTNEVSDQTNLHGRRVITAGVLVIGLLVFGLSLLTDYAQLLVGSMGGMICLLALLIWPWSSTMLSFLNIKQKKP